MITYVALILTVLFWGFSFIGTKIALVSFSPFVCVFLRFSLASFFFLIILWRKGLLKLNIKEHKEMFILALFQPGLYFTFETIGLTYTSASEASIILGMVPLTVMLLARFLLGEKITRKNIIGIFMSVLGISILVLGAPGFNWGLGGSFFGDILIIGAVISAAFYMVYARDLGKRFSALQITGFQVIYGTIIFAPLFLIKVGEIQLSMVTSQSVGAIIFLSIFATIGGFLAYNFALTRTTASKAAVFINGIPVVTAVGAWIILGERLSWLQIIGGIIVLLGVFITSKSPLPKDESGKGIAAVS